jgi:hypothetical protein
VHYISKPTVFNRFLGSSLSNNKDLSKRLDFEYNMAKIRRYIISLYGSGNLSIFQIVTRETIVNGRHAFRLKKFGTSIVIFIKGFGENFLQFLWFKLSQFSKH